MVTSGPTSENIDPVRVITNLSSGRTGQAVARGLALRGAKVTLVSGEKNASPLPGVDLILVKNSAEMRQAVEKHFPKTDLFFSIAAVSDFFPSWPSKTKISSGQPLTLKLKPSADILAWCGRNKKKNQYLVGFSLQKNISKKIAQEKLINKNCDLIVANSYQNLSSKNGEYLLVTKNENIKIAKTSKENLARRLIDFVLRFSPGEKNDQI